MGCDIHGPYIEQRAYEAESVNGEVWYAVATMHGKRDYRLFGLLAGVRGRAEPVIETFRDYPPGLDYPARVHVKEWAGDCHSASWATLEEMRIVADAYRTAPTEPGWEMGEDARSEADLMVALMEAAETPDHPTRAVFCFDN